VACVEQGGAAVWGRRGRRGRSWDGRRGAPARGGARGGDSWAEVWPEGAVLSGPGCSGWRRHDARRSRGWV
jgi:hypothetical protein